MANSKIIQLSPPKGWEDVVKGKLKIEVGTIPIGKGIGKKVESFCEGSFHKGGIKFKPLKDLVYSSQHLIGRSDEDEFWALADWDSNAFTEFYASYESPTFCLSTFTDKNALTRAASNCSFIVRFYCDVNIESGKTFYVTLKAQRIYADPEFLSESQNYSSRTSGRDLSEAIRSILR